MIFRVSSHQYGISALVTQTSFCEGLSGDLVERRLFSQATILLQTFFLRYYQPTTLNLCFCAHGLAMFKDKITSKVWHLRHVVCHPDCFGSSCVRQCLVKLIRRQNYDRVKKNPSPVLHALRAYVLYCNYRYSIPVTRTSLSLMCFSRAIRVI